MKAFVTLLMTVKSLLRAKSVVDVSMMPLLCPMAVFNIALGLLCGSLLGVKQVGGICGALLTNISAWLSGVWFDLKLVGGFLETAANFLPFVHAVEMEKALFGGELRLAAAHLLPIILYSISATAIAAFCFFRQMKKQ